MTISDKDLAAPEVKYPRKRFYQAAELVLRDFSESSLLHGSMLPCPSSLSAVKFIRLSGNQGDKNIGLEFIDREGVSSAFWSINWSTGETAISLINRKIRPEESRRRRFGSSYWLTRLIEVAAMLDAQEWKL